MLDGTLIGTCGVRLAEPGARDAEYGCELAPSAWGHGYADEGSRAVLDHGFRGLGLHRVFSSTIAYHAFAIALAERLGMRREGLRENVWLHGRWQHTVICGVLDREWLPAVRVARAERASGTRQRLPHAPSAIAYRPPSRLG